MHLDVEQNKAIKQQFDELRSLDDFARLLNYTNTIFSGREEDSFTKANLCFHAFKKKGRYILFDIPKKNKGVRTIVAPCPFLKLIQRNINFVFSAIYAPSEFAHGFAFDRSIVSNAEKHINKNYVLNVDLDSFFPSIKFRRVKNIIQLPPFNLVGEKEEIGFLIANLVTHDGYLPQGAPSSPLLSNIICQRLDKKLSDLAAKYNATYTRYADDITFSSYRDMFRELFRAQLKKTIESERFSIKTEKTRLQNRFFRQEVTGLIVNEKVNVKRAYIRELRVVLNNWETKGIDFATQQYNSIHLTDKTTNRFQTSIAGKLGFLKNVLGESSTLYQKYYQQFLRLKNQSDNAPDVLHIAPPLPAPSIPSKNTATPAPSFFSDIQAPVVISPVIASVHNQNLKHQPLKVLEVLSLFKKESALKYLVHDEDMDYESLSETVENARKLIEASKAVLPYSLWGNMMNLYYLYKQEGIAISKKTNNHPLADYMFKEKVQEIKRRYRLGQAGVEETNLSQMITKIIREGKIREQDPGFRYVTESSIETASVLTDVHQLGHAIRHILKNNFKYEQHREIRFSLKSKFQKPRLTDLYIIQPKQRAFIDPQTLLDRLVKLEGDLSPKLMGKAQGYLFSRCDWSIQADFEGIGPYELKLLDKEHPEPQGTLSLLDSIPEGFTHKITIYG